MGSSGLVVQAPVLMTGSGSLSKVREPCTANSELTLEAWVKPRAATAVGPLRILTFSTSSSSRNFTLGQGSIVSTPADSVFAARLRTTSSDNNGQPDLESPTGTASTALTHIVFRHHADGNEQLFVDGAVAVSGSRPGDFSGWDPAHQFALANELGGGRPWLGEFRLVSVFCRALSDAEVAHQLRGWAVGTPNARDLERMDSVLKQVEAARDEIVDFTSAMVRVPTVNPARGKLRRLRPPDRTAPRRVRIRRRLRRSRRAPRAFR